MPSEDANTELRKWLKRHPQPVTILCFREEGDEPKKMLIGQAKSRWRDAELAVEPYPILEALDDEGNVLRRFEREDEGTSSKKGSAPYDPESARLTHFATLLANAHAQSAAGLEKAFEKQSELLASVMTRNSALEAARQKELEAWAKALNAQAGEGGDLSDTLVQALGVVAPALIPMLQTKAAEAANGKG